MKNPQSKAKHCKALTGITDTTTPKLDLDNVSYKTAKYWAFKILRLFKSKSNKMDTEHKNRLRRLLNREIKPKTLPYNLQSFLLNGLKT